MTTLRMTRGDTTSFALTLTDADGAALDLTDLGVTFTARRILWTGTLDADGIWTSVKSTLELVKTESDGITVNADPTTGLATLTIDSTDTEDWTDNEISGPFDWDIEVRSVSEAKTPEGMSGVLVVRSDITLPVAS